MYYTNETANKEHMEEMLYHQNHGGVMRRPDNGFQSGRDVGGINISVNPVILVDCGERTSRTSSDTTTTNNPSVMNTMDAISGFAGTLLGLLK